MPKCKTERSSQVEFIAKVRGFLPHLARLVWAVPNQAARRGTTAPKLVAEGLEADTPDIFVAVPRGPFHGLFIELKREHDGTLRDGQDETLRLLSASRYAVAVAEGYAQAWSVLIRYLGG